jgi:hypothetical protein
MKRYDTHRNFPPTRRPRDSTPAPPEEDELERLLAVPRSEPNTEVVSAEAPSERNDDVERSALPVSSSVADAVTSYVESLPASDPEPRIEDGEIDVDAEAARRAENALETVRALKLASAPDAALEAQRSDDAAREHAKASGDDADHLDDEAPEPDSVQPSSAPSSESLPVDSIAALAQSTAPKAGARSGFSPLFLVAGFALAGIALALLSMRNAADADEKAAAASHAGPRPTLEPVAPVTTATLAAVVPSASPVPSASVLTPKKALSPQGP